MQICGTRLTWPQPNLQIGRNHSSSSTTSSNLCLPRWHIHALPPHWISLCCSTHTLRFVGLFIRLARAKAKSWKQRTQGNKLKNLHRSWSQSIHVTLPQQAPSPSSPHLGFFFFFMAMNQCPPPLTTIIFLACNPRYQQEGADKKNHTQPSQSCHQTIHSGGQLQK